MLPKRFLPNKEVESKSKKTRSLEGDKIQKASLNGSTKEAIGYIDESQESNIEQLDRTGALFDAIESENVTLVERLLKNDKNELHQRPLHLASGKGNFQIVKLLLDCHAAIDVKDDYQQTALHKALWNGHASIVELLLSKGADIYGKAPKKIGIYSDI